MTGHFVKIRFLVCLLVSCLVPTAACASGVIHKVHYDGSDKPGELVFAVDYYLWVPDAVATLRGVIVHQHGCGTGACQGGVTAAQDLHWQALARKWDCALMGSSYQAPDGTNCRLWCDPRNGSEQTFLPRWPISPVPRSMPNWRKSRGACGAIPAAASGPV